MRSEISALVTISSALALAGAATLSAAASAPVASTTSLTPEVLIVDDDGLQCPGAERSIQAAINKASAGAVVQVCPGIYTEFLHIDKSLTLIGQPEAIGGLDCFDSASSADDLDPTRYALLSRPEGQTGNLVTVAAGGVTVAGLVLQNARTRVGNIEDAAIHLQSGSAGATVHHNLFRLNGLGVDLGSDGSAATRVHHNCLRDNDWGMASQRQDFVLGTVDHNETFRTLRQAYEVGWPFASTRDSVFSSNESRQDDIGFTVTNSSNVTIVDNDVVHPKRYGVYLGGRRSALALPLVPGNESIDITDNRIKGGRFLGIFFTGSDLPSHDIVVSDNKIADFAPVLPGDPGFGIGLALNALVQGVEILDNVMKNNVVGLSVNPTNSGIVVRDNTVTGNLQQGIFSRAGVAGALYKDNLLLGNAPGAPPGDLVRADARDDNRTANTWIDNVCQTDVPFGTICGVD